MAQTIRIGEEVTIGTQAVEFDLMGTEAYLPDSPLTVAIETSSANAGTIQFAVGISPPVGHRAYAASAKIVMQGIGAGKNLWAVASALNQKFTVT